MLSAIFLKGFKTFARPVRMPLSGGITAVVGPNGAGKSNITDAVLFALGEGSPGVLRVGSMSDLIFSGSESLRAVNAAEVTLVLDNAAGEISLPYREVSLTRRIQRGGENEYRINGARARLADVRAVAGEAGLGRHSILRQGAVDAIVAGGATACRMALEEAAGLGVFRRRRQDAGRKLERAAAQLESSRGLEAELADQLRRIEAEAAAAREYRDLEARYRKLSLAHLYQIATRDLDGLKERLSAAEHKAGELAVKEDSLREEGLRLGAEERELESRVRAAELQIEGLEKGLEGLRSGALRAERTLLRLEGSQNRDADRRRMISRLQNELEKTAGAVKRIEGDLPGLEVQHSREKEKSRMLEEAAERGRADLAGAAARRADVAANLESLRTRRERAAGRLAEETAVLGEVELERLAQAGEKLAAESPEGLRKRSGAVVSRAGELRGISGRLAAEVDRRSGILGALIGRAEAGVRGLQAPVRAGSGKRLYEVVRARPGYEAAVEAALGSMAGGMLAENLDEGIRILTGDSPAESVVVRLDAEKVPENGASPGKPLVECVDVLDGSYAEAVARLLGGVYVLEELGEASPKNGHVAVTLEGLRLTRTSASRRSRDGEFTREVRLAEEEASLRKLKDRLGEDLYDLRETLQAVSGRVEVLMSGAEMFDARVARAVRAARLLAPEAERRAKKALRDLASRSEGALELERMETEISTAGAELQAAEMAEEKAKETYSEAAAAVEPALASTRASAGRLAQARTALADGQERLAKLSRELKRLRGAVPAGETEHQASLAQRAAECARRLDDAVRARLAGVRHVRSEAAGKRGLVAGRRAALATDAGDLAAEAARACSRAEALSAQLARAHEAASGAEAELFEEWGATLQTAREEAGSLDEDTDAERGRLARKLKSFGDVNLLAISQEGSLRERHDLVAAQRADAEAAAIELERIIQRIDEEIGLRFEATFGEVRRAFGEIVPRMMEGALGELSLSEEGVEIGLRLKRRGWRPLRVLSGGERALLALSFLFGIFLGQPRGAVGAFCVLDEAEAALDDINLARFLSVVDSYRSDGQFLLVTHQKRTMAAADVLYGVTPDATGATIVVSKRLTGD